jgi:hypothetical protein
LQQREERLHGGVVTARTDSAHRSEQAVVVERADERVGPELGGFNWSSQHLDRGGVDGQASGVDDGVDGSLADEVAGGAVPSAGGRARVWREIAKGLLAEEAALAVGASQAVGARWFRHRGGMPSIDLGPLSGRYLSFREREEIAILKAQDVGVREIAWRLGRAPSTISREAAPQRGDAWGQA